MASMVYRPCTSPCEGEGSGSTPGAHPNAGIVQWQGRRLVSGLRRFDSILPAPVWRLHEVVACGSDPHPDGSLPSAASSAFNDWPVTECPSESEQRQITRTRDKQRRAGALPRRLAPASERRFERRKVGSTPTAVSIWQPLPFNRRFDHRLSRRSLKAQNRGRYLVQRRSEQWPFGSLRQQKFTPVAQWQEALVLETRQCPFEPDLGYHKRMTSPEGSGHAPETRGGLRVESSTLLSSAKHASWRVPTLAPQRCLKHRAASDGRWFDTYHAPPSDHTQTQGRRSRAALGFRSKRNETERFAGRHQPPSANWNLLRSAPQTVCYTVVTARSVVRCAQVPPSRRGTVTVQPVGARSNSV
jgi:hypothetical protein